MLVPSLPHICIIDDDPAHSQALYEFLNKSYRISIFESAQEFLASWAKIDVVHLIVSDINMPVMTGYELLRRVRLETEGTRIPVILISGVDGPDEKAHAIEAGADDILSKPFSIRQMAAKINSLLEQSEREKEVVEELNIAKGINFELETKLKQTQRKTDRWDRLRKFLSPNLASVLTLDDYQMVLKPHRAEVAVLFVDLRRFTAFSDKAEPEEVLEVLRQYYTAVGNAVLKHKGTLGQLAGDGIMIFFNDPEPLPNFREVALRTAIDARDALLMQRKVWRERQYDIDFGMGISEGHATIGGIGFEQFSQYSVIGMVTNFASRLCSVAKEGQIVVSKRFISRLEKLNCETQALGEIPLKGISRPVTLHNVLSVRTL